jgi:hypothetical protein
MARKRKKKSTDLGAGKMIKAFRHQRFWDKPDGTRLQVRDAKYSIPIVPNAEDIQGAIRGDPCNCPYARYCKRVFGSTVVFIKRGVAYVEMPDTNGKLYLYRFILTTPAKSKIKEFDDGEELPAHAVIFAAPKGSRTLHGQALAHTMWEVKKAREQRSHSSKGSAQALLFEPVDDLPHHPAPKTAQSKSAQASKQKAHIKGFKRPIVESEIATLRRKGSGMFQFVS